MRGCLILRLIPPSFQLLIMKHILTGICALLILTVSSSAQAPDKNVSTKNGVFYFSFGTQRIFYTQSDISVHRNSDPSFDFTLYNVKAKDEGGFKFHTAPQFSWDVGYYFKKKKFGLEYHYDHIKYFVTQNQVVHMKGTINHVSYDRDTTLVPEFFKMEHSDGANYAMVNIVKWLSLTSDKKQHYILDLLLKAGAGVVNPKTNTTIMGNHRDDKYHISGYVVGFESGLRFNFFKYVFVTGTFKGTFANYSDFLIAGGRGSQKWFAGQFNYMIGGQFPL